MVFALPGLYRRDPLAKLPGTTWYHVSPPSFVLYKPSFVAQNNILGSFGLIIISPLAYETPVNVNPVVFQETPPSIDFKTPME